MLATTCCVKDQTNDFQHTRNSKSQCYLSSFTPNLSHSVFASNVKFPKATNENLWIIDTGATDHMVYSLSCLTTVTFVVNAPVELPNGVLVSVTHIGTVQVAPSMTLTNVLCVPSFQLNLISVSKLVHSLSCCLIFITNYCLIQAFTPWRMIGLGKLHNGFYMLQTSMDQSSCANLLAQPSFSKFASHFNNNTSLPTSVQSSNNASLYTFVQPTSMQLWHYRLGHSSFDRLQFLHQYV